MFKTIADKIKRDKDYPQRQFDIDVLTRILEGTFYDHLTNPFHQEKSDSDEYIPLRERRPSVRANLCRGVVDDSVSLLFSEGHFPTPQVDNPKTLESLKDLIKETKLNEIMISAATVGSVGSVVILMRVLKNDASKYRVFFEAMGTALLTPTWKKNEPDTLEKVRQQYKISGAEAKAMGATVTDEQLTSEFWFARDWDKDAETWWVPWPVKDAQGKLILEPTVKDDKNTVEHKLGFVPMVWVRNLPGGNGVDGASTFRAAVETAIEIDYLCSQGGRGLYYASDPTLLIKEPAAPDASSTQMVKGAASAIVVSKDGDAKLLEINGTATTALIEWLRMLREIALESVHGNRANPDKMSSAQSGRAMELLYQALIWLADRLRSSYGEGALLSLLKMVVMASTKYELTINGKDYKALEAAKPISLKWPAWFPLTLADKTSLANALKTNSDAGHMSRETAVKTLAPVYDIEDVPAEIARIETEEKARLAEAAKNQANLNIQG